MKLRLTRNLTLVIWALIVGASAWVNYTQWCSHFWEMGYQAAEGFFRQVLVTRSWNADHGRVYVPVTSSTQPNSYLSIDDRDIPAPDGTMLTVVNPAYMTRQLSELAARQASVHFRITSLDPLRPENAPTVREQRYLERFEHDPTPAGEIVDNPGGKSFFYMAPLVTEKACLQCHEKQGYQEGDIRGGVSVEVPYGDVNNVLVISATHAALFGVGGLGILMFFSRLGQHVDQIEYDAGHDGLTGVLNRRVFMQTLSRELRRSRRSEQPLSLLMIDVDDFKHINDSRGHDVGDQCLRQLARTLMDTVGRPGDAVGRYGGEEFAVVLPETDLEAAEIIAERVRAVIDNQLLDGAGDPLHMTVSIGVAHRLSDETTAAPLLKRADDALYQAKRRGKNRIAVG